ncbi:type II toxin-antitoxin system PemK/MazF family toxin [Patescibacteria group bacterium]|nr:type II toxin-antitoxin system PemK/MazF family toxin [Patescibacteria group bacterium]
MKRGDVWWVKFPHSVGGEIKKTRPAVIISNNPSNEIMNRVQIIPLTSNISRVFSSEALIKFSKIKSKALAHQIQTVSKIRLINKEAKLSKKQIERIDNAIKVQLGLL